MSERKVLNKYYPPDFDPSKIPRMKLARNRQYTVRLMAPFNMRCKTCGEYIYKGKKFNARKEDVEGDDYLGIRIYRFYIKCTRCLQEISFKTDPQNTDYEIEAGATRNFMALKLAEEQAQREEDEKLEEEATNPMKLLEKRTQQSKQELELLESLEELKDLNRRQQTIDYDQMLEQYDTQAAKQRTLKEQEELDEEYVKSVFKKKQLTGKVVEEEIVMLPEDNDNDDDPPEKVRRVEKNLSDPGNSESSHSKPSTSASTSSSWSSTSWSTPSTTNLSKKKSTLGVKIIPGINVDKIPSANSSSTITKITKPDNNSDNESEQQSTVNLEDSKKPTTIEKNDKQSGLSLLGTYSGSSSDDDN